MGPKRSVTGKKLGDLVVQLRQLRTWTLFLKAFYMPKFGYFNILIFDLNVTEIKN